MAIEHADFEGVERLALVLGGEIVSTFDSPEQVRLWDIVGDKGFKFGQCFQYAFARSSWDIAT